MKVPALLCVLIAGAASMFAACTGGNGDSSSGGIGGIDGGAGSDGGDACATGVFTGERVCVIGTARANVPLTVEAQAQGCVGCGTSFEACDVTVEGATIKLSLVRKHCDFQGECAAICQIPQKKCTIPPLAAGRYQIEITNAESVKSTGGRELVVAADGGDDSCELGLRQPTEIKAASYNQTCTIGDDASCELVSEGDPCGRCPPCPTAAVAKTDAERLNGDYREEHALCSGDLSAECAACPPERKAVCAAGTCTAAPL